MRVTRGADAASDHQLLLAIVKLKLMKHTGKNSTDLGKRFNTTMLANSEKRKISNWNLDTVSQPSENSKNEDDNDAIEENRYQIRKTNISKLTTEAEELRSQAERHHSTV